MGYIPGEEQVTKTVEDPATISAVYRFLMTCDGDKWGSTRFNSHGYVDGLTEVNLSKIQRKFPNIEFKITAGPERFMVEFRTSGSASWHPSYKE